MDYDAQPRTHWDGCWRVHPACAIERCKVLEQERDEARQVAARLLRDLQQRDPGYGVTVFGGGEVVTCSD
jgi:hypothetical protein